MKAGFKQLEEINKNRGVLNEAARCVATAGELGSFAKMTEQVLRKHAEACTKRVAPAMTKITEQTLEEFALMDTSVGEVTGENLHDQGVQNQSDVILGTRY